MFGEEHGHAFVVADPSGVACTAIGKMRGEQRVEPIISQLAFQRFKTNFLHNNVAVGIAENFFVDFVTALIFGVGQFVDRHARLERHIFEPAMAFLFRKKSGAVSDQQALVAGAGLIYPRKIDLIQNSMTEREPYPAVLVERRAHSGFCARRPARRNARPPGSITFGITQSKMPFKTASVVLATWCNTAQMTNIAAVIPAKVVTIFHMSYLSGVPS